MTSSSREHAYNEPSQLRDGGPPDQLAKGAAYMMPRRRRRAAVVVAIAGLSICAPAVSAHAETGATPAPPDLEVPALSGAPFGPDSCAGYSMAGQGGTAGTENKICQGSGLVFVGPSVGQIATVIGPTIIGPAVIGTTVVSAGNVAAG
jgi:hypothetical protein